MLPVIAAGRTAANGAEAVRPVLQAIEAHDANVPRWMPIMSPAAYLSVAHVWLQPMVYPTQQYCPSGREINGYLKSDFRIAT